MRPVILGSLLFLVACDPPPLTGYDGAPIYQLFQYDTIRTWTWQSTDTSIPFKMIGTQREETEKEDVTDIQIYAIDFTADCFNNGGVCEADSDGTGLRDYEEGIHDTWKLSTEVVKGVRFHEAGGVVFDPAVKAWDGTMLIKEQTSGVESGGVSYTGEYAADELCPAQSFWPDETTRPMCYKLTLDDGGADTPIAGSYWVVKGFGVIAFSRDIDNGATWTISDFDDNQ